MGGINELSHWPIPAWRYKYFCPNAGSGGEPYCANEVSSPVKVFNTDSFTLGTYVNQGTTDSEKYPDVAMQSWRFTGNERRMEGCDGKAYLGHVGKDCGISQDYTAVAQGLFVSSPKDENGIIQSTIHTERNTGLRFDYRDVWQLNRQVAGNVFVPLFWMERRPEGIKLREEMNFKALKTYGGDMMLFVAIGYSIYVVSYFILLYMFFYFSTCVEVCNDRKKKRLYTGLYMMEIPCLKIKVICFIL